MSSNQINQRPLQAAKVINISRHEPCALQAHASGVVTQYLTNMFTFCSNIIIIELIHLINIIQTSFQILNIKTEAHGGSNFDKLFDVNKSILVLVEYVECISETESEVSTHF